MTAFTQAINFTTGSTVDPQQALSATTAVDVAITGRSALAVQKATPVVMTQAMTASPAQVQKFIWGRVIAQAMTFHQSHVAGATFHITTSHILKLAQTLRRVMPVAIQQNLTVQQAHVLAAKLMLLQRIGVLPAQTASTSYHLALVQALIHGEALGRFLGLEAIDGLSASDATSFRYVAKPTLTQSFDIAGSFTHTFAVRLTSAMNFTPSQVIQMIYTGDELLDTIDLTGLYLTPGGGATAWAINTRTAAVTEYTDYAFNSFAAMGLRYVAASADGIYELDGATDDGRAIEAEIQSGLMRLNASKLAGLKGAYLAVRGEGQYFLKVISGDGREYVYQVIAQPEMMTTKVNVGKGLRMTYMAFNLKSTGQDFDLDALEFVPMLSDRRV